MHMRLCDQSVNSSAPFRPTAGAEPPQHSGRVRLLDESSYGAEQQATNCLIGGSSTRSRPAPCVNGSNGLN